MFYTIPRFHNPLGTSYTESTKKAIAELATRYDVYVIEDDYLADLETDSKSDPIYAYAPAQVVYLKSYSKILFPGLRVGVAVLPEALQDSFRIYKQLSDIDSSMLSQAALEIYIQSGMFERRKQRITATYQRRLQRLNEALDACNDMAGIHHATVHGGVHSHITLPDAFPLAALLSRLAKRKWDVKGIETGYLEGYPQRKMLKLSITRVMEDQIEAGVRTIFEEIRRMRHSLA